MRTEVKTYTYPNGEIQRVQLVRLPGWEKLEFLQLSYSPGALDCFANIYRRHLVPACPWLFGNLVMFRIPGDVQVPFSFETKDFGQVGDTLTAAAAALKEGVRIRGGMPRFQNAAVAAFWRELEARDCIRIVRGKLPITTIIPVGSLPGYLSQTQTDAALRVNASFFIMDKFDCATVCDHIGTPLGLRVKDGTVLAPPLFRREALLVKKDGSIVITAPDIRELSLEINGELFRHGENATIYTRPERARTPRCRGKKLVVIGCRVAAVSTKPRVPIPASGFVVCVAEGCAAAPGHRVRYRGLEDVAFGIQVGNSIVKGGIKTGRFHSRFYNIRRLEPVPFPPSLYPMNFRRDRAARIALGADRDGAPMLLWAEGAGKLGYVPGQDSRGATLQDMAEICRELGMENAVNLDGGGSAQLLLEGRRALKISDRSPEDFREAERPIPLGLMVR